MPYLTINDKLLVLKAKQLIPQVSWFWNDDTPIYGIGNNNIRRYNCWCPHNLQYDSIRNRFIFVQCHKTSHSGANYVGATMHIVHPEDPLKREDISIPEIIGIANLLILDDGTYLLYPKTTDGIRYVSTDGGETWALQSVTGGHTNHFFGVYICNGKYYAGCDSVWGEYHYSEDGIAWQTKALDWTDENGCHTKEHSFCYWNDHVYAFGRRDFYVDDDASKGLVPDYNGCAVVFRLDGDAWTMVDDSHLLAFQSDCCPVAFEYGIAIAHINRVNNPSLIYSIYDGQVFTTVKTFENICLAGEQQEMTTPSLAFGDGYACIAFSVHPQLVDLGNTSCINTMIVGTYKGKGTKEYFTHHTMAVNTVNSFRDDPDNFVFYPSGSEEDITWRWQPNNPDNIVNNNADKVYFYWKDFPFMYYRVLSNNSCDLIYNGEFVDTSVLGTVSTSIKHNWIMDYDGRHFAIGGKLTDYGGVYASLPRQFVVECSLSASSIQPDTDLSSIPDGTVIRTINGNGGVPTKNSATGSYLEFIG